MSKKITPLEQAAQDILSRRTAEIERKFCAQQKELRELKNTLKSGFEVAFSEMLPMLKDSGITYEAGVQNESYPRLYGTYIEFRRYDPIGMPKSVKMDFNNPLSYRYEFRRYDGRGPGESATCAYGQWPLDGFLVYLYENLF